MFKKLVTVYNFKVSELHSKVDKLGDKLNILSPISSINRGYGLILDNKGHVIKTVNDIKEEEKLSILLKDGIVESKVVKVNKGEFKNGFN